MSASSSFHVDAIVSVEFASGYVTRARVAKILSKRAVRVQLVDFGPDQWRVVRPDQILASA